MVSGPASRGQKRASKNYAVPRNLQIDCVSSVGDARTRTDKFCQSPWALCRVASLRRNHQGQGNNKGRTRTGHHWWCTIPLDNNKLKFRTYLDCKFEQKDGILTNVFILEWRAVGRMTTWSGCDEKQMWESNFMGFGGWDSVNPSGDMRGETCRKWMKPDDDAQKLRACATSSDFIHFRHNYTRTPQCNCFCHHTRNAQTMTT
eukprot:gene12986-biopygen3526